MTKTDASLEDCTLVRCDDDNPEPTERKTNVTYEQALKRGEKAGASRAGTQEFLALLCKTLASLHAINPALVFAGTKKRNLSAKQVAKLAVDDPVALGDLMFG